MEKLFQLNINQIQKFLPHKTPFLLVDRILEIQLGPHAAGEVVSPAPVGTRVVGIKNVTFNEPHFQGHFPNFSILPGVLIIESMAQVASFSIYPHLAKDMDRLARDFQCILVGVDQARFRKPVVPGDTLRIETEVVRCRGKLWAFQCTAFVDGHKVAEAEILANLVAHRSEGDLGF